MVSESPTEGPALLRSLRSRTGVTQEDLADAAGVHVRTVRGLESGRVLTPRRTSIDLLAQALGLDAGDHLRLRLAWGISDGDLPTRSQMLGLGPVVRGRVEVIEDHLAQSTASLQKLTLHEETFVGADRRVMRRRTQEVLLALQDDVSTHCVYYDTLDPQVDNSQLHLTCLENCTVAREVMDPAGVGKLFLLTLGRTLRRGDSLILRYSADFDAARPDSPAPTILQGEEMVGFLRSPASCVLEVHFDHTQVPEVCQRTFASRPAIPSRTIGPMQLSTSHTAHLALLDPKPGAHGIAWRW